MAVVPGPEKREEIHEMPADGAWSEDGQAWFPRSAFPTRAKVRSAFSSITDVPWIEVRVLARFARFAPEHPSASYYDGEYWHECDRDEPGAFPVWRCE